MVKKITFIRCRNSIREEESMVHPYTRDIREFGNLIFPFPPRKDSMDRRIAECIEVEELVILITFYVAAFHFL